MGVIVHKNSLVNCNLLTKSGFSQNKVDYFDGNLLNKKMVVTKMLTKSRLLTILQVTKSGFHCTRAVEIKVARISEGEKDLFLRRQETTCNFLQFPMIPLYTHSQLLTPHFLHLVVVKKSRARKKVFVRARLLTTFET